MVCSADSIIYVAGSGLVSYDLKTGIGVFHGNFPNFYSSSGDMVFQNGKLYLTISGNKLLEVNIEDPAASVVVASYPQIPLGRGVWGIASNVYDCDSSDMFLIVGVLNQNIREFDIYSLDFPTQQVGFLCTGAGAYYYTGSTTYNEFLTSDCSVRLNLDKNRSSGADSTNYQLSACGSEPVFVSDTSDIEVYSGYRIDSLRLQLMPLLPDESLAASSTPATLTLTGQNSPNLTFGNTGNVLFTDFQAALRGVYWQYTGAGSPPAGQRTVQVVLYARGGRQDTAFAYLNILGLPQAGRDSSIALCADAAPLDLNTLLSTDATTGGNWLPALPGQLFDPATMGSGTFQYIAPAGECQPDTAVIYIEVQPLPVFSLGNDAAVCTGDTLSLSTPLPALWQDGSMTSVFAASDAGLYWAEITDAHGCIFRDSVLLGLLPLQQTQETIQLCYGQAYSWNGQVFQSDTTICAVFSAFNGCDSTHCLTLDFFYPFLSLDTTLCAGESLLWEGQAYTTSGMYTDTASLGGCLTALRLELTIVPNDTIALAASICPGSTYTIANQQFKSPGSYLLNLPTQAGCDSIISLNLAWWPLTPPLITGDTIFCPGSSTTLYTSGFVAYQWSVPGAVNAGLEVTNSGLYTITATDANGCTATAAQSVTESSAILSTWELMPPDCAGAADGWIELLQIEGGESPFSYSLNNAAPVSEPFFENLPGGMYTVQVMDAAGCAADTLFVLDEPSPISVFLGPDVSIAPGATFQLTAQVSGGQGALTYLWSPPAGLNCTDCPNPLVTPLDTVLYVLTVTDANGCSAADSIRIAVQNPDFIYIPNVFSPDGDGKNDFFGVFADPDKVQAVELLRVYDRWGSLVYESPDAPINELTKGWNGTFRGKLLMPGVYVWHATIRLANGTVLQKTGDVLLKR